MPQYYSDTDRHIEGMFGSILRNLENNIRGIHDILPYPFDLIAEHQSIFTSF